MSAEMKGRLVTARQIKDFATGGNATLTIRSTKTEVRFTYRIRVAGDKPGRKPGPIIWFVSVMAGPDNETSFLYFGNIRSNMEFDYNKAKAKISHMDERVVAFDWMWHWVRAEKQENVDKLEVWHEGRCGKCGRKLTVPESIESGFGPECKKKRK